MTLLKIVVVFPLLLSGANWLLFLTLALTAQRAWVRPLTCSPDANGAEAIKPRANPEKLVEAAGGLASAFGVAGPAASAAAMSLVSLLIAALAAGADKL